MKNKKTLFIIIGIVVIVAAIIFGVVMFLNKDSKTNQDDSEGLVNPNKSAIKADFVGISFERKAETGDTETIRLNADGTFAYYCSCGNSVDDADICEFYTYNTETKEIKFICYEDAALSSKKVTVKEASKTSLKLDFDGEIREFKVAK